MIRKGEITCRKKGSNKKKKTFNKYGKNTVRGIRHMETNMNPKIIVEQKEINSKKDNSKEATRRKNEKIKTRRKNNR